MKRAKGTVKTLPVEGILDEMNERILKAKTTDGRIALANALEEFLFAANRYRGFNYVEWLDRGGYERWQADGEPTDTTSYLGDQTLVRYY